ncbi:hypothetical protein Nepgr_016485 [Nepenthes gracilis]|uniref:Uncharacterized protein n=1 Tax=Nepenthes gracilis TaxID=150966 RepID=A0AAD3SPT3_NEPGR|nr:hypothetical protein Nepgr_016485 [Nepenthes gracilis]
MQISLVPGNYERNVPIFRNCSKWEWSFEKVPGIEHEFTRIPTDSDSSSVDPGSDPGYSRSATSLLRTEIPSPDSGREQSNFMEAKKMASGPQDEDRGAFYKGGKGWMAGEVEGSERKAGWEESWNGGGPWGREGLPPPS